MNSLRYGNKNNPCFGSYGKCLDIKITNACNAQCNFCIEKGGYCPQSIPVDKLVEKANSIEDYRNVLILGGEPFAYPHLTEFISGLKDKDAIYITTNGSMFTEKVVRDIASYVTGVNVSVHHYDEDINSEIYQTKLNMNNTRHHIKLLRQLGVDVRVNCNFVKSGINTNEEALKMIDYAKWLGANSIRFAELQNAEDVFVAAEDIFDNIHEDPFNDGCEQVLKEYSDIKVIVRTTCGFCNNLKNKPNLPKNFKINREPTKVLYPNGKIMNGWLSKNLVELESLKDKLSNVNKDIIKLGGVIYDE